MMRSAIVLSFCLLMLPSLSLAECADETSVECIDAKAAAMRQSDSLNTSTTAITASDPGAPPEATAANSEQGASSRNNKRRTERPLPRFAPADPRDTVLSSDICVYSSASYTYTCR